MPAHHDVRAEDIIGRRLHATLAAAADRGPADFPELLLTPGVGARTVQALARARMERSGRAMAPPAPRRFFFTSSLAVELIDLHASSSTSRCRAMGSPSTTPPPP